jgi:ethanolaminephosphotransferase
VTVTGFMCNVITCIMINYYSGLDGQGDIPTYAMFLAAFLYWAYHIIDILDGKHARNTGQSSPLGLLMDHGCDALTTFLFTMSLGSILKLSKNISIN